MNKKTLEKLRKEYDYVSAPISNGSRVVKKGGSFGVVDKKGKLIVPVENAAICLLDPDESREVKGMLWCAINANGKVTHKFLDSSRMP